MPTNTTFPFTQRSLVYGADPADVASARIKALYLDKQPKVSMGNVGKAQTLRERILTASLFPNVFSKN
jgi:hypothetical protein